LERRRIVSLVPSATETLLAWGITPVAVTRFCEQPSLRSVGGTKDPDVAAIVGLHPDLVVVCDQENRREDFDALVAAGVAVHAIRITHVDHVGPQMEALRAVLDLPFIAQASVAVPRVKATRAWIPIWKRPWMTISGDTYGSTLLASIGVENILHDHADRYPTIEIDAIRLLKPDVVLAPSEPYPFAERHRALLSTVAPTVFIDGQDLFWWGARTEAARERLADALTAALPFES
jgi:ABC-type Fe3+-hydroxamate transport system substrate-binding protein